MGTLPQLVPGHVRIAVHLRPGTLYTPGDIAQATGLGPEDIGHIVILDQQAYVDVRTDRGREARAGLRRIGPNQLVGRCWLWLRLAVGRNHGLSIGQLRKIMEHADALPLGRIAINNTHTLVGICDNKSTGAMEHLASVRINGFNPRPELLAPGEGPGSAAFDPARTREAR